MFNEASLEKAIIESLKNQEYEYVQGDDIHKELSDVLLRDDFKQYMMLNAVPRPKITSLNTGTPNVVACFII